MKSILINEAWNIFDYSEKNTVKGGATVTVSDAVDILAAALNARAAGKQPCDNIPADYGRLDPEWSKMNVLERGDAVQYTKKILVPALHELGDACAAGDRETFEKLLKERVWSFDHPTADPDAEVD